MKVTVNGVVENNVTATSMTRGLQASGYRVDIDPLKGPWESFEQLNSYMNDNERIRKDGSLAFVDGMETVLVDEDGNVSKYIREKGDWRQQNIFGGGSNSGDYDALSRRVGEGFDVLKSAFSKSFSNDFAEDVESDITKEISKLKSSKEDIIKELNKKQDTLVIKTIDGQSLLGEGDIKLPIKIENNVANIPYSVAEGYQTNASGLRSHAEGELTTASGGFSHAEGRNTEASNDHSHAEGYDTTASGPCSHAEGYETKAIGEASHAEGYGTATNGDYSHTEGVGTQTNNKGEHAEGTYNKSTTNVTRSSIGIGQGDGNRKNAFEVTDAGKVYINGIGGYNGTNVTTALSLQDFIQIVDALPSTPTEGVLYFVKEA